MDNRNTRFQVLFSPLRGRVVDVWDALVEAIGAERFRFGSLNRNPPVLGGFRKSVQARDHFNFESGTLDLNFGHDGSREFSRLFVEDEYLRMFGYTEKLLDRLSSEFSVRQAGLFDIDYHHRQTAEDILEFEVAGWPHAHLKKVSNGAPPPLEQLVVDTSENPGRFIFKTGYCEFVANPIWLGPTFFEIRGLDPNELPGKLGPDWQVTRSGALLRISCQEAPFRSSEGRKSRLQNELRAALYS